MFTISYSDFVSSTFYNDYTVSSMPGIDLHQALSDSAMVVLNVDTKVAYVYC
jgi:hypothetical protein